jgi:hypothetical protein
LNYCTSIEEYCGGVVFKKYIYMYLTIPYKNFLNKCCFHLYGECDVTDYNFGRESDDIKQMTVHIFANVCAWILTV